MEKSDEQKQFPIIFPVVGFSDAFYVDGTNYDIPKHGFWRELKWSKDVDENKVIMTSKTNDREDYPFNLDLKLEFEKNNNEFSIRTTITNRSSKDSYFHFGYHPAFKIDNDSKINYQETGNEIDFGGSLNKEINIDKKTITKIGFGSEFDTIVYKTPKSNKLSYSYSGMNLEFEWDSINMQLWKPKEAMFLCVEPWDGEGDREKELIEEASKKKFINKVKPNESFTREMIIRIK